MGIHSGGNLLFNEHRYNDKMQLNILFFACLLAAAIYFVGYLWLWHPPDWFTSSCQHGWGGNEEPHHWSLTDYGDEALGVPSAIRLICQRAFKTARCSQDYFDPMCTKEAKIMHCVSVYHCLSSSEPAPFPNFSLGMDKSLACGRSSVREGYQQRQRSR
jgi:hypothetical protein